MEKLNLSEKEVFELLENRKKLKEQLQKEAFLEYTKKKLCHEEGSDVKLHIKA